VPPTTVHAAPARKQPHVKILRSSGCENQMRHACSCWQP
jgi:hypothetical protein